MNTGQRLKQLREEKGLSQEEAAKLIGVGRTTYLKYESGENRPVRKLDELTQLFNVSSDYIMGISPFKGSHSPSPSTEGVKIPILGTVVAGLPVSAVTDILGYEEITQQMARTGQYFALRVKGESMYPYLIEGDTVIVREQPDVESNDMAIVLVNGDEATIKRIKKSSEGITLYAYNVNIYEPHFYSRKEIAELPVRIIGKVVEVRRQP